MIVSSADGYRPRDARPSSGRVMSIDRESAQGRVTSSADRSAEQNHQQDHEYCQADHVTDETWAVVVRHDHVSSYPSALSEGRR